MTSEAQASGTVLMVRPAAFGFHPEAAQSNAFAKASGESDVQRRALVEFEGLAERLSGAGIEVLLLADEPDPTKPDAIFPNNWVSFHGDGTMVLYPMATAARRLERGAEQLQSLLRSSGFEVRNLVDLSAHEAEDRFLEGTGSLILDRPRRRAYASLSPRTDAWLAEEFGRRLGFSTLLLDAHDRSGRPIYHTNVLLSLGTAFAVLCTEVVTEEHRAPLISDINASGRTLIEVDYEQLGDFACNLIELRSRSGDAVIALSSAALRTLRTDQRHLLESFGSLVDAPIPTIEGVGGGSVRCMIADIHLPRVTPAP